MYKKISGLWEIEIHDNLAYVSNRAGLLEINFETGAEKLFSGTDGFAALPFFSCESVSQVEVLSNGNVWVATDCGLFYKDGDSFIEYTLSNGATFYEA